MKKLVSLFLLFSLLLGSTLSLVGCPAPSGADPYAGVLSVYTALLSERAAGEELTAKGGVSAEIAEALRAIVALDNDPAEMGYARRDINRDGVEELILMRRDCRIYALFTVKAGAPVMLLGKDTTASISIDERGEVYWNESVENVGSAQHVKYLEGGELVGFERGDRLREDGSYVSYQIDRGEYKELTRDDLYFLNNHLSWALSIEVCAKTREAGFYFIPALPPVTESTAPLFDASSYDAILAAYRRIALSMSECTRQSYLAGAQDDLFRFTCAADYEIFFSIFQKCYAYRPTATYFGEEYAAGGDNAYGYAKKDLNGDGAEELILLTDAAELIAVFTQKADGTPVFLPTTSETWIDESGVIYNEYYETFGRGNSVYEVKNGGFRMIAGWESAIDYGKQTARYYLLADGERVLSETGLIGTVFEGGAYEVKSGYTPWEYTKSHAGLSFIPLFERAAVTADRIGSYKNPYYISSGLLTISTLEGDTLTFSVPWLHSGDTEGEEEDAYVVTDIAATATRDENGLYRFTFEGAEGYIEFAVTSVFVVITESDNPVIDARARHYTARTDD